MKQIRNRICLGLALFGLAAPLQIYAAGRDLVALGQDGNQVRVSLEMSNAVEEQITTVAVSLEVKSEEPGQMTVDFQFAPELGGTERGFVYNNDTGRLDIYVASARSLFTQESLNLGNVRIQPLDSGQSISADVSYCENSFQTANGCYGDKIPVVEDKVPPVNIQVGNGALPPPATDSGTSGSGNTGIGSDNTGSGSDNGNGNGAGQDPGQAGGGSNRDQGLYDETTRFVNDPAAAQKISSQVVRKDSTENPLVNFGTGKAATVVGKRGTDPGVSLEKTKNKVSVISPENGPSGILVSKGGSGASGESPVNSFMTGADQDSAKGEGTGSVFMQGDPGETGSEEILLDQKNGGAVDNRKHGMRNRILMLCAVAAGILIPAGGIILLAAKKKKRRPEKKKGKKKKSGRRRKKKKSAGRPEKPGGNRQKPAGRPEKPVVGRQKPAGRPEKPVVGRQKPAGHPEKPGISRQKPAGRPEKPVVNRQKPAGGPDRPAAGTKKSVDAKGRGHRPKI